MDQLSQPEGIVPLEWDDSCRMDKQTHTQLELSKFRKRHWRFGWHQDCGSGKEV